MNKVAAVVAIPLASWASACQEGAEIRHPNDDNLPPPSAVLVRSDSVPSGMAPSALSEWRRARAVLLDAKPVARLGRLGTDPGSADDPQVFGLIADVEVGDDERVYVLDRQQRQVRIFDFKGEFVGAFGQPGSGPNEFRDPTGLELLANGRVAVSDRGAQLKVFAPAESQYEHERTVLLEFVPEGLCSTRDRIFLAAGHDASNTILHEASTSLHAAATAPARPDFRSFGEGYQSDNWLVRSQLSDGRIACLDDPVRVVFAFELLPVVRAYSGDGYGLLWEVGIEGYAQMEITERLTPRGRSSVHYSSVGTRDVVASMRAIGSRHVLVQYHRGDPQDVRDGNAEVSAMSYLIDATTGRGAVIDAPLPLIAAIASDHQVAMWPLPYPRLELRTSTTKWGA